MTDHFIKNIEIKDFKCFDNFKAEGFARVNLIGGKNNLGKTAFMEACYVNTNSLSLRTFVWSLHSIKVRREFINLVDECEDGYEHVRVFIEQSNNIFVKTNINTIFFNIEDRAGVKKYFFEFNGDAVEVNVNDFSYDKGRPENSEFIDIFGFSNYEFHRNYSSVQKKDKEKQLDQILKDFDPRIDSFKIIDEIPQCKIGNKYLALTELGDGVRHLVAIVTSLYDSENGYLYVDEVENGIHYTALDNIWNIILKLSKELNVQVFATTHSKECIESFNRVQLKLKDKQSSYFELAKEKSTDKIFMSALSPSQLEYELSHEGKFRGE